MAWTAPKTFSSGSVLTAAELNTHLRDNLLETAPAKAANQGGYFVATAANAIAQRIVGHASDATGTTSFTNTSFADLDALTGTPGAAVAVTVTTGVRALVLISSNLFNATAGAITLLGYRVSGATTTASSDNDCLYYESGASNDQTQMSWASWATLTAGSNTFELQARVISGTGAERRTQLIVIPF